MLKQSLACSSTFIFRTLLSLLLLLVRGLARCRSFHRHCFPSGPAVVGELVLDYITWKRGWLTIWRLLWEKPRSPSCLIIAGNVKIIRMAVLPPLKGQDLLDAPGRRSCWTATTDVSSSCNLLAFLRHIPECKPGRACKYSIKSYLSNVPPTDLLQAFT